LRIITRHYELLATQTQISLLVSSVFWDDPVSVCQKLTGNPGMKIFFSRNATKLIFAGGAPVLYTTFTLQAILNHAQVDSSRSYLLISISE
jgi:hypothetical protein